MNLSGKKEPVIAYGLWLTCLLGLCGSHRFYLNKPVSGLIYVFTFGLLGFGQLADLLLIPYMIDENNRLWGLGNYNNNEVTQSIVINNGDASVPKVEKSVSQKILTICYGDGATVSEIMMTSGEDLALIKSTIDVLLSEELIEVSNRELDGKLIYKTV